jgi:Domain of unknown function (DUF4232)
MAGRRTRRIVGWALVPCAALLLAACNGAGPSPSGSLPPAEGTPSAGPLGSATPSPVPQLPSPSVSPTPSASPTPSPVASATPSPAPETPSPSVSAAGCTVGQLGISVVFPPGHAAGSTYYPVVFSNVSETPCTLSDPVFAFVTAQGGARVGPPASAGSKPATTLTLAPGDAAHALLQVPDTDLFDPSKCRPVSALTIRWLRVTLPGQPAVGPLDALYAPFLLEGEVCSAGGSMQIQPLAPGPWPPADGG